MARAIIRLPFQISRSLLKGLSAVITFILAFYCYATGQVPKTASPESSLKKSSPSFFAAMLAADPIAQPEYGVEPLYGVVVEYGVPYADFLVKGTIRNEDSQAIAEIQVALHDTATDSSLVSTTTNAQGEFSLALNGQQPWKNTWLLKATDLDGDKNRGEFADKDTLISIPLSSLEGSGTPTWYQGKGEIAVELYLKEKSSVAASNTADSRAQLLPMAVQQISPVKAHVSFFLPEPTPARLRLYDASGAFIAQLLDINLEKGTHSLSMDISKLGAGTYFFRLDSNGYSRVTKATLAR